APEGLVETAVAVVAREREVAARVSLVIAPADDVALTGGDDLAVRLNHNGVRLVLARLAAVAVPRTREVGHDPPVVAEARIESTVGQQAHETEVPEAGLSGGDDLAVRLDGDGMEGRCGVGAEPDDRLAVLPEARVHGAVGSVPSDAEAEVGAVVVRPPDD